MNKDLLKKIGKYGAAAGATLAAGSANADIVYTDVAPDSILIDTNYVIDLNNDGTTEISVSEQNGYVWGIAQALNGAGIAATSTGGYLYASNMTSGAIISSSLTFMTGTNAFSLGYNSNYGNFRGDADGYIAIEFTAGGNTHYGWVHVDIDNPVSRVIVKGYAYNDIPDSSIAVGVTSAPADAATAVVGTDAGDALDASDLNVAFTMAADESTVGEYRVMVVPSALAGSFNVAAARLVPSTNYTAIAPAGTDISQALSAAALDVTGNAIQLGSTYQVFVLSTPTGSAYDHTLSAPSADVTLEHTVDGATNVVATDVADNFDATDIEVSFDMAADETGIGAYRIFVVPSASAGTFTLATAQSNIANAFSIFPTGANISQTLPVSATDSDGNAITAGSTYQVFIMSEADGVSGTQDSLSAPSVDVTLSQPIANAASNLSASDVSDNYNATDFQASFDKAADETYVDSYEIHVVKSAVAGTFDLTAAQGSANGIPVAKTGSNISVVLPALAKDSDGDAVTVGVAYKFFVLSVATTNGIDSLSAESNEVTLSEEDTIDAINSAFVEAKIIGSNGAVTIANTQGKNYTLEVISINGTSVHTSNEYGDTRVAINAAPGAYIIRMSNENGVRTTKVVL